MARESDKHGPRVDEEMKKETQSLTKGAPVESRAQESREKEGPADGEPTPDEVITTGSTYTPQGDLGHDELEARQDLARYLEGKIFQASRDEILADAVRMHAPQNVLERLEQLPSRLYEGFPDVWEALKRKSV